MRKSLHAVGRVSEQIFCQLHATGLEKGHDGRAAESEVSLLVPLLHGAAGGVGLENGTHTCSAHGKLEHISHVRGVQDGKLALVCPEPGELAAQAIGAHTGQRSGYAHGGLRCAVRYKMEAVVVHRAEATEHHGSLCVFLCQFGATQQGRQVKLLAFHKSAGHLRCILPAAVATICWQSHGGTLANGAGAGLELAVEEIVEALVLLQRQGGFLHVDVVLAHKIRQGAGRARRVFHSSQQAGENGTFYQHMQAQPAQGGAVYPAQGFFAQHFFLFHLSGVAIVECNTLRAHAGMIAYGHRQSQARRCGKAQN